MTRDRLHGYWCAWWRSWKRTVRWPVTIPLFVLTLLPATLHAIDPLQLMAQMEHSAWTGQDGLNGSVYALAQTRDRYLWVGTSSGLYLFDGIRFKLWDGGGDQLPSNNVSTLMATPDGGLWVGFLQGGAAFIKNGRAISYPPLEAFPVSRVRRFAMTQDGRVWAAAVGGFVCLSNGKWSPVGASLGYLGNSPDTLFVDDVGTLWAATGDGSGGKILVLRKGASRFEEIGVRIPAVEDFIEANDGRVWAIDAANDRFVQLRSARRLERDQSLHSEDASRQSAFDRDDSLWIAGEYGGLRRIAHPKTFPLTEKVIVADPRIELFRVQQGLSGSVPETVLQDIEGNIWVGTLKGLDRFRYRNVSWATLAHDGGVWGFFRGDGPDVWAAVKGDFGGNNSPVLRVRDQLPLRGAPDFVLAGYRDADGSYWLSQHEHFWHYEHGRLSEVALPGGLKKCALQATRDASGHLWIALSGYGLYRRQGESWVKVDPLPDQPSLTPTSLYASADGQLWVSYVNAVVCIRNGTVERLEDRPKLAVGPFNTVSGRDARIWIGGEGGLATQVANSTIPLTDEEGHSFGNVSSIIDSVSSGLWFVARARILHVDPQQLRELKQRGYRVHADIYDQLSDLPSAVGKGIEGGDGLLWFDSADGIVRMDPSRIRRNLLPPSVLLEAIRADDTSLEPRSAVTIPPGKRDLRIDFTALSLTIPERIRAKYRLVNWDREWQDAGDRREASYTNLPPGTYEFHVIAANNDGVWNNAGATVVLRILPTFYQTWWFRTLCAISIAVVLWGIYLYQIGGVKRSARERMMTRLDERERIARELHDSLLQSFQALVLHLQIAMGAMPENAQGRKPLEGALDRADGVILQARDRVMDLRRGAISTGSLADSFLGQWGDLASLQQCGFEVNVTGSFRQLKPEAEDEIRLITSEAISNALRYSHGTELRVQIEYGLHAFSLRVTDNGIGMKMDSPRVRKEGHWGLVGMRERAVKLDGRLEILSGPEPGVTVNLSIPSRVAYAGPLFPPWVRRIFQKAGG